MEQHAISAKFPYTSHYLEVQGSKMHYIEEGNGEPILFLHGIPTSSYLWRNIIPYLSDLGHCIAPDLIGLGKSDKPEINYNIDDHIAYIEAFIDKLNLNNITLVLHAWGSVIGFDYAMRNPDRIKAIAFLEAHIRPVTDVDMVTLPVQELASILQSPDGGYEVIMHSNYFVNKVLPSGVLRRLTEEELLNYQQPFLKPGSCKPLWQYLQDLPLDSGPNAVTQLISRYSKKLAASPIPKLMLYAVPGFNTPISTVEWARDHLKNLTLVDIGEALHYAQETNPIEIGSELRKWYKTL